MVLGGGRAKWRVNAKMTVATPNKATVKVKTLQFSPGGVPLRGP